MRYFDGGTSSWNIAHLMQMHRIRRFCKFDFGVEGNLARYGQEFPPDYPLGSITSTRIALIYSQHDFLASFKDVQLLKLSLKGNISRMQAT